MTGTWLGLASAALSIGAWAVWLRRIEQVNVPRDRRAFLAVCLLGVASGIGAFGAGVGIVGGGAAALGIAAGGVYLGLRALSRQDARVPAVAVGGPILDFSAPDDQGRTFQLGSLRGKPVLLKFFRGHW